MLITFTTLISGWTLVVLMSNTAFKSEINEVIQKMYLSQKVFLLNVKDLSLILIKDANKRFSDNHHEMNKFNIKK